MQCRLLPPRSEQRAVAKLCMRTVNSYSYQHAKVLLLSQHMNSIMAYGGTTHDRQTIDNSQPTRTATHLLLLQDPVEGFAVWRGCGTHTEQKRRQGRGTQSEGQETKKPGSCAGATCVQFDMHAARANTSAAALGPATLFLTHPLASSTSRTCVEAWQDVAGNQTRRYAAIRSACAHCV